MGLTVAQREARAARQAQSARNHERYVQRTYGLAPGQYAAMLADQDGRCAICMKQARTRRLAVDHDHNTGAVRALLCSRCNEAVGRFEYDRHVAYNAATYLTAIARAYERTPDAPDSPPLLN